MSLSDKATRLHPFSPGEPGACYRFDEFELDRAARMLSRDAKPVELGSRAIQLLIALIDNRDRVVGKEALIQMAWPRSVVVENNLPVAIFALRRVFQGRNYIQTSYGEGYRFVGPVTAGVSEPLLTPVLVPASAMPERPCIAVLPFVTKGCDPDQELFGDGIAEDIIGALSRNRWLRVIPRGSSFSFKPGTEVGDVARQLGARYILQGTIRRAGNQVRVTAHLNDATSNTHLVSEHYDRVIADIFAVQDDLTVRIVEAVRPVLFEAEQDRSFRLHPDSIDAWTAYQRGMWYLSRREDTDVLTSLEWFRRAMALDPRYAPGYYGMSRLLGRAGSGYSRVAPHDWQSQAETLAMEAVKLDGRDSGSHSALGYARYTRGDHLGAIVACEAAVKLNPSDSEALATLGATLVFAGRQIQGIEALQASIDLDPRDPRQHIRQMQIGLGLYFLGDMAAAEEQARFLTRAYPDYAGAFRLLAMVLAETGRHADAITCIEQSKARWPAPFDDFSHARMPWYREVDFRRVLAALRQAGWTGRGD